MTLARTLGVVAVLVALVGCSPTQPATPQEPDFTAPPATPTSTAQARETGLVAPAQVFGGDCAALFTDDEVGAAVGLAVTAESFETGAFGDQSIIEQRGGIQCIWRGGDWEHQGVAYVWIVVVPEGSVEYEAPTESCFQEPWDDETAVNCLLEDEENGVRISGWVYGEGPIAERTEIARSELLTLFTTRAAAVDPVPAPIPAEGAWAIPWECEDIVAAADFSEVPGLGADAFGEGEGGRGGVLPWIITGLHGKDQLAGCVIRGSDAEVSFVALGGMRWKGAAESSARGATPLDVDGLDSVLASPNSDGSYTIDVLDGPNWLTFNVKFTKNAGPIATSLVAALDASSAD